MEDVAAAMGAGPRWFQLYWSTDEPLVDSFIRRAEAIGSEALVVTLDTTMLGWRPQDLNLGQPAVRAGRRHRAVHLRPPLPADRRRAARAARQARRRRGTRRSPPAAVRSLLSITREHPGDFRANLRSPVPRAAVETFLDIYSNPGLSWDQLATLRDRTSLPFLVKGVLHPDDARRAVELGASGIVVSQPRRASGGRRRSPPSTPCRPSARPWARRPRSSSTAGCARAPTSSRPSPSAPTPSAIGRPYIYGLALAGETGVRDVLANLVAELDLTMGLAGVTSVDDLGAHTLHQTP